MQIILTPMFPPFIPVVLSPAQEKQPQRTQHCTKTDKEQFCRQADKDQQNTQQHKENTRKPSAATVQTIAHALPPFLLHPMQPGGRIDSQIAAGAA